MPPRGDIVQPRQGPRSPRLGPVAVLAATEPEVDSLVPLLGLSADVHQRLFTSRLYPGPVALAGPAIGAPYAAMLVETLTAWGVRRLILVGWCGSLIPEVPIGSAVVPSVAWIEEGTSRHYLTQADVSRPDTQWSQRLADACASAGATVSRGGIWTTDALFRENPAKVERYRGLGAVAVDMEASALFTVAGFLGIAAAAVLVVSDDLSTLSWRPGFRRPEFRRGCEQASRAAAALALSSVPPSQKSI